MIPTTPIHSYVTAKQFPAGHMQSGVSKLSSATFSLPDYTKIDLFQNTVMTIIIIIYHNNHTQYNNNSNVCNHNHNFIINQNKQLYVLGLQRVPLLEKPSFQHPLAETPGIFTLKPLQQQSILYNYAQAPSKAQHNQPMDLKQQYRLNMSTFLGFSV